MAERKAKVGITRYGAYLPRLRLQRQAISDANSWFDASLKGLAKGERTMCHWDEDTITMAVEACTDCLSTGGPKPIALLLASTTLPFLDRQNSVLVAEALGVGAPGLRTLDVAASQRAATSGLLAALDIAAARDGEVLLVASEHRRTRCGSREEMVYGDGAAAVALGAEKVLAEVVATHSEPVDFVDHYRVDGSEFDYGWEERWIRDEGLMKIIPRAVAAALSGAGVSPGDVAHFVVPTDQTAVPAAIAKKLGIRAEAVADNLAQTVGITGAAHPLLLLSHRLEQASPGDLILVIGFGQGCDAVLFRATDAIRERRPKRGVSGSLAARRLEKNYSKFQSFNDLVDRELGKRAEIDKQAYLAAMYRRRGLVNSFMGGRCTACNTIQMPKENYCVNPECGAYDTQVDHPLAGVRGRVATWTADRLTFDFNPPAYFGLVVFEGGGRFMMDMTEVDPETFDTGAEVSVHFRIKQIDHQRGFRKYFWKAIPTT
jgi:3-hydroxy-3-methylglutaryl CoA synthase